jgi:hypothetical protein
VMCGFPQHYAQGEESRRTSGSSSGQ